MRYLFLLLLVGCASNKPDASPGPVSSKASAQIVSFGDSFTAGIYASKAYPVLIGEELGLSVDNKAVGGMTMGDIGQLESIREYPFTEGQIVILMSGFNDTRKNMHDPAYSARFQAMLTEALDIFEAAGVEAFVGGCMIANPMWEATAPARDVLAYSEAHCSELALITYNVIANGHYSHVHFVDTHGLRLGNAETVFDYLHPNDTGQELIKGLFKAEIERFL